MNAGYLRLLPYAVGIRPETGRAPALALLPLRLFLGATFIYAGLQKLTDPQFFSPTAPGFIGHQMTAYVHGGSPLSFLLTSLAIPQAKEFGALIAYCELWVGFSAVLGLLTRLGALGGLAINFTFFLTATWNVHPYFLGADLPYAVGWLSLALAGPDRYTCDEYFLGRVLRVRTTPNPTRGRHRRPAPTLLEQDAVARATIVRWLGTTAGVIVGGGIIGAVAKLLTPNRDFAQQPAVLHSGSSASGAPAGATLLGNVRSLPVNSAGQYTDPLSGDPAVLIHLPNGTFVAYDAVCTHAGCTVQYDPSQHLLVCPCHGAEFDPSRGAQVVNGPAGAPLTTLSVQIAANGNAFAKG